MSYFIRNGNTFRVADNASMDLHNQLPPGNYTIKAHPMTGELFLEQIEQFERINKVYGDTTRNAYRIIQTFLSRPGKSTGVMLTGEKGSGKTLLAKTLSIDCAEQNIPTIVINSPWHGDAFNKLIQDIDQPCMVLFDEFEKVYDGDDQESILTLLDGVYPSQKLFVLTCNDKWRVDKHMRNRPGRIFYMLDFRGLDQEFIREYCVDNLDADKHQHINKVCQIASMFSEFNFDMLKALIEEMNRYNEEPKDALKMLNAKPEFDGGTEYSMRIWVKNVERMVYHPRVFEGNPLDADGFTLHFKDMDYIKKKKRLGTSQPVLASDDFEVDEFGDVDERDSAKFTQGDLVKVNPQAGSFEFVNPEGDRCILTRVMYRSYHFDAF
jgi:adenylylsulfate kinase-like enzyme